MAAKLSEKYVVKIKAYQCDVGDGDLTKRVFKTIESELGEITGLIAVSSCYLPALRRCWELGGTVDLGKGGTGADLR